MHDFMRTCIAETATAEELVRRLEGVPVAELGKFDAVMAGLVRAELNLNELLRDQHAFRERTINLRLRISTLIGSLRLAFPGRWDPAPPAEPMNAPPNTTGMPQKRPEEE